MNCPCEERLQAVYLSPCELLFLGHGLFGKCVRICSSAFCDFSWALLFPLLLWQNQGNLWTDESLKVEKSWWQEIEQLVTLCVQSGER